MGKSFRAILLIALAMGSMAASQPRRPTDRWVVNYDDAQCVASRDYGSADKKLVLALKPSPTASVMRLMLIRNGSAMDAEQRPASIRFDGNRPIAARALAYGDRKTRSFIASVNLPYATVVANRKAAAIEFKAGATGERLAVPGLAGVMAAFDDCLANLRTVWNVGREHSARVARPAQPSQPLRDLFRSTAYPAQAVRQGDSGMVAVAMLIDEAGRVRDCMVEQTSGYATLDTTSCFVISSKARFDPALDPDGKPVKSASFQRINWRIAP